MDVAIAGAGIGGLATAAFLAGAGHSVRLFDQFAAPAPTGSGLVIQPVGLAVLDLLGAGPMARAQGAVLERMLGIEAQSGARVLDVAYRPGGRGQAGLAIHRATLFDLLWRAALQAGAEVSTGQRIMAAPLEQGRRLLVSEAGRFGPFDLVVDGTGAGSPLSPLRGRALGYGAVWGTVPWPAQTNLPADQLSQRYIAARRMAGVLPIGTLPGSDRPMAALFWSLPLQQLAEWPTRDLAGWKDEVLTLWPEMAAFLPGIGAVDQMTAARYTHGTLRRPYAEALAFIGDAAHRASPQLGQGANMALLDALALTRALERASGTEALARYAAMRRWHVRLYQGLSAAFTPQYQSDSRLLPVIRDRVLAPLSRTKPLQFLLARLVSGTLLPPIAGLVQPGIVAERPPEA